MSGNARSGRRPKGPGGNPRRTGAGRPIKPDSMQGPAARFWAAAIATAPWLTLADGPACVACCQLYALMDAAIEAALDAPEDKFCRTQASGYYASWAAAAKSLGLDPLGRERLLAGKDSESDLLREYGIVG